MRNTKIPISKIIPNPCLARDGKIFSNAMTPANLFFIYKRRRVRPPINKIGISAGKASQAAKEIINKAARNISDKRPDIIKAERRRQPTILEIRFTRRDSKSACGLKPSLRYLSSSRHTGEMRVRERMPIEKK